MTFTEVKAKLKAASAIFCKPGTERVEALCARLGMPQNAFPVIHVTGTNGKGSTSCMLEGVLRASGYRTGQFSSPYLISPTECVRIDGRPISAHRFAQTAEKVFGVAEGMADPPTEFELITVIAFLAFAEAKIDVGVIEVCMGGRTDATNVIDAPLLSVITGVHREHTAYLGDTVEQIAAEKAGIIKTNCPVLYGGEDGGAYKVIEQRAKALSAPLHRTFPDALSLVSADTQGTFFTYRAPKAYFIPLLGLYQIKNAALALDALALLQNALPRITEESIRVGLRSLSWEGRFERLCTDPPVYFDGAHNPDGIAAAKDSIMTYFPHGIVLVGGILADKDYRSVVRLLAPHVKAAFTVTPKNPRALPAKAYAEAFKAAGIPAISSRSVGTALTHAMAKAQALSLPVLCIGSLYLYAEIRKAMDRIQK